MDYCLVIVKAYAPQSSLLSTFLYKSALRQIELDFQNEEFKQLDDCSIEDIIVIKSIDPECDKEAIKSIRNLGILQKKYSVEKCQEQVLKKPYNFKMN